MLRDDQAVPLTSSAEWHLLWRNVAQISRALSGDDPRYIPILKALSACQNAYKAGDREQFNAFAEQVKRLASFVRGASIRWETQDQGCLGPAQVKDVFFSDGRLWVRIEWNVWSGWVSETVIKDVSVTEKIAR